MENGENMTEETRQAPNIPTDREYAIKVAEFYLGVLEDLTKRNIPTERATAAATIATNMAVSPYHYFKQNILQEAGVAPATSGTPAAGRAVTPNQKGLILRLAGEGKAVLTADQLATLQNGTMPFETASRLITDSGVKSKPKY